MPPASTAGDHGPLVSQHSDNRPQTNTSQTTEQIQQQQNFSESHASPSPSTKKGSFFKKNVEDGMDRYDKLISGKLNIFNCVAYLYLQQSKRGKYNN